jgi:hypothetical protein
VLVVLVLGLVLLSRGGHDSSSSSSTDDTSIEEETTVVEDSSTTLGAVRFTIVDQLGPNDQSEDVEVTIGDAPTVRFSASPPGVVEPHELSVAETGTHSYELVVTTHTKEGVRSSAAGSGELDIQPDRQFEVATVQGTPGAVCLSLDRVCQG